MKIPEKMTVLGLVVIFAIPGGVSTAMARGDKQRPKDNPMISSMKVFLVSHAAFSFSFSG
jgi:hypothetical protein